jgi:hypothetical protein
MSYAQSYLIFRSKGYMYFLAHLFTILYNVSTGTHDDLTYGRLQVYEVHRSIDPRRDTAGVRCPYNSYVPYKQAQKCCIKQVV